MPDLKGVNCVAVSLATTRTFCVLRDPLMSSLYLLYAHTPPQIPSVPIVLVPLPCRTPTVSSSLHSLPNKRINHLDLRELDFAQKKALSFVVIPTHESIASA